MECYWFSNEQCFELQTKFQATKIFSDATHRAEKMMWILYNAESADNFINECSRILHQLFSSRKKKEEVEKRLLSSNNVEFDLRDNWL